MKLPAKLRELRMRLRDKLRRKPHRSSLRDTYEGMDGFGGWQSGLGSTLRDRVKVKTVDASKTD